MRKRRSRFFGGNSVTCSVIYFQHRPQYLSTGGGRVAVANTGHFLVLYFLACCWRMQITCRGNSAGPLTRHQQCLVSLVCHLISSGDMIPLCGILSWVASHAHWLLSAVRMYSRCHSVLGFCLPSAMRQNVSFLLHVKYTLSYRMQCMDRI